jgi:hypothetical protein
VDCVGAILVPGHHMGISNIHGTRIMRKHVQIFPEIPEIAYMEYKFSAHSRLEMGETQTETFFFLHFKIAMTNF